MDFQVLVLAAPIEDNMIFDQKSTKFQAHFYKIVWKSAHSWSMPIEDKIVLAKKVWNSKLIFYSIVWKSDKHRGMPIEDKWFFAKKVWNSELIYIFLNYLVYIKLSINRNKNGSRNFQQNWTPFLLLELIYVSYFFHGRPTEILNEKITNHHYLIE